MWEHLSTWDPGEIIALVSVVGGLLAVTIVITSIVISVQWRRAHHAEIQADMIKQMLERGMSAADIEQVMKASRMGRFSGLQAAMKHQCGPQKPKEWSC